jgi:AcrR family transcriptional regulator
MKEGCLRMDGRLLRSMKTREKLLKAAKEIFIEKGFQDTSITQIAKKAGIGYGTAYTHFKGKDAILIVVMEGVMSAFYEIAEMQYKPTDFDDARKMIKNQITLFLNLARTEQKILRVLYEAKGFSEDVENSWVKIRNQFTERIESDIHYVQEIGLAKPSIQKHIMAKGWFFVNEMYLWDLVIHKQHPYTVDEIAQTLVEFYTTGLYQQG